MPNNIKGNKNAAYNHFSKTLAMSQCPQREIPSLSLKHGGAVPSLLDATPPPVEVGRRPLGGGGGGLFGGGG